MKRSPLLPALCASLLGAAGPLSANDTVTTVLPEVTVTADSAPLAERHAAVTQKTVIDRAEIEALGGLTVGEVIRKLPGIDAGQHGGDGAPSANARGMGRDSVQFLVDGERPSANSRFALTLVGRLPSGELERIEILRGASAEHGGAAPVTVNLVMKKTRSRESTSLKVAAGARGGEANGQFSVSRGGGDGGFSWIVPVSINHHAMPQKIVRSRQTANAGIPTLQQEEAENSPYLLDELILSPRFTWKNDGDNLTLWPSWYGNQGRRNTQLTRNPDGGRQDEEGSALRIARLRADGEMRLASGVKLSGRAALMDGRRSTDIAHAAIASTTREQGGRSDNEFSAALRLDRPMGEQITSFGLEHATHRRDENLSITGTETRTSAHEAREQQWTAWAQHEWNPAAALTLTVGARGESILLAADGASRRHGQFAPSLAARLEAGNGWVLRTSAGGGIKAPKLDEISGLVLRNANANSPLEADRGGNPALRPERNINFEAAAERHLGGESGVLGINLYLRRTEDFIERRAALESGRWVERPYNEGTARHRGLELDAKLRTDGFGLKSGSLRTHLTLPRARVDDQRLGLTRDARDMPRYQWSLGFEQTIPAWSSSAGFQVQHNGPTRTAVADEIHAETHSRTLLDAHLVRRLTPSTNLRLAAQNLLRADTRRDAAALSGADTWDLSSTERGSRTWLVSLEGKW